MAHSQIEADREEQREISGGDQRKLMKSQPGGSRIRTDCVLCLLWDGKAGLAPEASLSESRISKSLLAAQHVMERRCKGPLHYRP